MVRSNKNKHLKIRHRKKLFSFIIFQLLVFSVIIFSVDVASAAYTDFLYPTQTGELYNDWATPRNALYPNDSYALSRYELDEQDYYNFDFGIPSGSTIVGIWVVVEAHAIFIGSESSIKDRINLNIELYCENQQTWSDPITNYFSESSDEFKIYGGPGDTWGQSWVAEDFSNSNFKLKATYIEGKGTLYVDAISVNVSFEEQENTPPSVSNPYPEDNSLDVELQPRLGINISDNENLMTLKWFEAEYEEVLKEKIESDDYSAINESVGDGRYYHVYEDASSFLSSYWWGVKVDDEHGGVCIECYKFTTLENTPPVAVDDYVLVDESDSISVLNNGFDSVLENDSDSEGHILTADLVDDVRYGELLFNSDGTFCYTHDGSENFSDYFTYRAFDGYEYSELATVYITINPVNDAPVVDDIGDQTVDEGGVFQAIVLDDYVSDAEDDVADISWSYSGNTELLVQINDRVASVLIPNEDWYGQEIITFIATDTGGLFDSDAALFTVNPVNDPPIAVDDTASICEDSFIWIDVLDNDYDVDGSLDLSSLLVVSPASNGTTNVNLSTGEIKYTPDLDWNGLDFFTYQISDDNGDFDTAIVNISVNEVNDPPFAANDSESVDEDNVGWFNVLNNDEDVDGSLDLSSVTIQNPPINGTAFVYDNGTIKYQPAENIFGADSFTYTVQDDDAAISNIATVFITINSINDAPSASFSYFNTTCNNVSFTDLSTDSDGTIVSYSWDLGDGNVSFHQNPYHVYSENGDYIVVLTVTDDENAVDTYQEIVTIDCSGGNNPTEEFPPNADFTYNPLNPDVEDIIQFTDLSTDVDGYIVNWTWDFGDGNISYLKNPTHQFIEEGDYSVLLNVTDNQSLHDEYSCIINVIEEQGEVEVNNPPSISNLDPTDGAEDQPLSFTWSCNISDLNGDKINWSISCNNGQISTGFNSSNGTKSLELDSLDYDTVYFIMVNSSDGMLWTNRSYSFSTESEPEEESEDPPDDSASNPSGPAAPPFLPPATENSAPQIPEKPSGQTSGFTNESYMFSSSSEDVDGDEIEFLWDFGDGNESDWINESSISHQWSIPGEYEVKVKARDEDGEESDWSESLIFNATVNTSNDSDELIENNLPVADFNIVDILDLQVFLDASKSFDNDGEIISYKWDFGDGNYSEGVTVNHTYLRNGTYRIVLTVEDNMGNFTTFSEDVTVEFNFSEDDPGVKQGSDRKQSALSLMFPVMSCLAVLCAIIILMFLISKRKDKPSVAVVDFCDMGDSDSPIIVSCSLNLRTDKNNQILSEPVKESKDEKSMDKSEKIEKKNNKESPIVNNFVSGSSSDYHLHRNKARMTARMSLDKDRRSIYDSRENLDRGSDISNKKKRSSKKAKKRKSKSSSKKSKSKRKKSNSKKKSVKNKSKKK